MNLSLKEVAELAGVSKVAILKAIQKGHISASKDDNQQWLVSASEATRYRDSRQHKAPANRKPVNTNLSQDNSGLAAVIAEKDEVIRQLNQRLNEQGDSHGQILAAKDEALQMMRVLVDQNAKAAAVPPPDMVAKIATLEAENALLKKAEADRIQAQKEHRERMQNMKSRPWWQKLMG